MSLTPKLIRPVTDVLQYVYFYKRYLVFVSMPWNLSCVNLILKKLALFVRCQTRDKNPRACKNMMLDLEDSQYP